MPAAGTPWPVVLVVTGQGAWHVMPRGGAGGALVVRASREARHVMPRGGAGGDMVR
ncbi:MAG: hypothetical protein LBK72_08800 [Bifidobacteriaceae bacterium]|nr:hypothetical protein [Bifidobacteriaceae bacterium]